MSFASEPELPKNTLLIGTGAIPISRSDSSAGSSVPIEENAWK